MLMAEARSRRVKESGNLRLPPFEGLLEKQQNVGGPS